MLEPVYALAPDLLRGGRVRRPPTDAEASREARMTDFRLLRHGGFYHAVARYGSDIWTPFTYAGLHPARTLVDDYPGPTKQDRIKNLHAAVQDSGVATSNCV